MTIPVTSLKMASEIMGDPNAKADPHPDYYAGVRLLLELAESVRALEDVDAVDPEEYYPLLYKRFRNALDQLDFGERK